MNVRGATDEERQVARRKLRAERRANHYRRLMLQAQGSPRRQLAHACDYMRAVANGLPDAQVTAWAEHLTQLADGGNKK